MIFKKIRKGHVDWRNFLCGTPANDYIFQKDTYEYRIDRAVEYIRNADCILIGAEKTASFWNSSRPQPKMTRSSSLSKKSSSISKLSAAEVSELSPSA